MATEEKLDRIIKLLEQLVEQTKKPATFPRTGITRPGDLPLERKPFMPTVTEIPCYFDRLPPTDRNKPMAISCPCRKCSPYSLSTQHVDKNTQF